MYACTDICRGQQEAAVFVVDEHHMCAVGIRKHFPDSNRMTVGAQSLPVLHQDAHNVTHLRKTKDCT